MGLQESNIVKNLQGAIKNKEDIIEHIIITFNKPYFETLDVMDIEKEIVRTKQLRKDIDEVLQRVKQLGPSREVSLTITKLQEGIMWLGMNLKRINELNPGTSPNPYPNSYNPNNTKIEPTSDGIKF